MIYTLLIIAILTYIFIKYQNSESQIKARAYKSWVHITNKKDYNQLIFPIHEFQDEFDPKYNERVLNEFIFKDNILFGNYGGNLRYILGDPVPHTKSAYGYNRRGSRPYITRLWALAAYPELFKYLSAFADVYDNYNSTHDENGLNKGDIDIIALIHEYSEDYEDEDAFLVFLRKIIDQYKKNTGKKLECRAGWLWY